MKPWQKITLLFLACTLSTILVVTALSINAERDRQQVITWMTDTSMTIRAQ